ncbi:MAG: hypothetical protein KIT11_10790 [Fimbriimonadaceae bacterium]|nr:hypothetical protein [Fimbriimonadaceae bacterium]QYK55807.1 MAG: hypothetical protein KF733_12460 [Fimbriimonadaceae bacterium]
MSLLLAFLVVTSAEKTVTLDPTDDIWVYQFAQDQTSDPYLRLWGAGDTAVSEITPGHLGFSYSGLKFSLPADADGTLKSAKLVLTHSGDPGFEEEAAKANPIEARAMSASFEEENWDYSMAAKVHPVVEDSSVFGSGWAYAQSAETPFKIEIDLLKGPNDFRKLLDKAREDSGRAVVLALTTKLTPEQAGESSIYKVFSRSAEEDRRPKLVLTFE